MCQSAALRILLSKNLNALFRHFRISSHNKMDKTIEINIPVVRGK